MILGGEIEIKDVADETVEKSVREREKNPFHTQVYPKGWDGMMAMMAQNANAARLYAFIANHMDPKGGVLVASQKVLATALEVAEITIRRASAWLEEHGHLVRVRVGTSVYAYALNPEEVWKSWHDEKEFAVFTTKTLVSKKDRENQTINRRIKTMIEEPKKKPEIEVMSDNLNKMMREILKDDT